MNKPVAWLIQTKTAHQFTFKEPTTIPIDAVVEPLYTNPEKELTDEEIAQIAIPFYDEENLIANEFGFARAILRKASEK